MAADRMASLKQRLRRGADSFEFSALLEGVSTLDDPLLLETAGVPQTAPDSEPAPEDVSASPSDSPPGPQPSLLSVLQSLSDRMLRDAARFASALARRETDTAGFHLTQLNATLEMIQSVDPSGAVSRAGGVAAAPPPGREWPSPVWTMAEFAASPLSGLLPPDATDRFARAVIYAAWGWRVDSARG